MYSIELICVMTKIFHWRVAGLVEKVTIPIIIIFIHINNYRNEYHATPSILQHPYTKYAVGRIISATHFEHTKNQQPTLNLYICYVPIWIAGLLLLILLLYTLLYGFLHFNIILYKLMLKKKCKTEDRIIYMTIGLKKKCIYFLCTRKYK